MMATLRVYVRRYELLTFFVLVFACSWLHTIPQVAYAQGVLARPPSPTLMGVLTLIGLLGGPIGAAALVTALVEGKSGLRAWLRPVFRWRVSWRWYAVVLLAYPVLALAAVVAADLLAGRDSRLPLYFQARLTEMATGLGLSGASLWLLLPILIVYGFIIVPLYEETGWRGFALPRLQQTHSALTAGLVIGVIWAVWHLPNFFLPGSPHYGMPFVGFLLEITAFSILMVWVYNNTGSSVWMTMLWHGSIIVGSIFFPAGIPGVTGDLVAFWLHVALSVLPAVVVVILAGPARLAWPPTRPQRSGAAWAGRV